MYRPFFESSAQWSHYQQWDLYRDDSAPYAPATFEEAAYDLADGCPSLGMLCVRNRMGCRDRSVDLACRIVRDENDSVNVSMRRFGGMVIDREEEW